MHRGASWRSFRCDLKWHAIRSSTQSIAAPHTSPKSLSGVLSSGGDFLRSVPGGPTILLPLDAKFWGPGHETSRGQPKNLPGVVLKTLGSLLPHCSYVIFATTPASMCNLDLKKSSHEKTGKNLTFYFRHLLQQHFVYIYLLGSKFCALCQLR